MSDPGLGEEFTTLALSYNRLAERLETTEETRRSMLADLAHEMRTPLATIDAHLEAVEDGIRPLDRETLGVVRGSTGRLRRLAEDMAALSRAEEGLHLNPKLTDAVELAHARPRLPGTDSSPGVCTWPPTLPTPGRCAWTRTGWVRCWGTCSTTRCATRRRAAP